METWDDFERAARAGVVMSTRLDEELLEKIDAARRALAARDLRALAGLVPEREHWRLYPEFAQDAMFFDIEAELWAQPLPLRLFLRTEIDLENGGVNVSDLGGTAR